MNRKEFCIAFAREMGISIEKANRMCKPVLGFLAKKIYEEDRVYITGLGTFKKKIFSARRVGNIKGGTEAMEIPPTEKITFLPAASIGGRHGVRRLTEEDGEDEEE